MYLVNRCHPDSTSPEMDSSNDSQMILGLNDDDHNNQNISFEDNSSLGTKR